MPPAPPPALGPDDARVSLSWPAYIYLRRWRPLRIGALCLLGGFLAGVPCGAWALLQLLNH